MKPLMYFCLLMGLFALPQCTKTNKLSASATAGSFPVQEGDYWVYKVTNFEKNTVDTVTVSVAGSIKMAEGTDTLAILQVNWPKKVDTQYVSVVADTVRVYSHPNETGMNNVLIFPLNRNYSPVQFTPTFGLLINQQALSSFTSLVKQDSERKEVATFQVKKLFGVFSMTQIRQFEAIIDDVAPGVGIVKESRERVTGPEGEESVYVRQTWLLLRFHLAAHASMVN